jgi:hypothetical protein
MNTNNSKFLGATLLLITMSLFSFGKAFASPPTEFEMPFDLAMAPDTRVVTVAEYLVGTIKEANGSLATTGSAKNVVSFYESALKDAGFRIFSKTDNVNRVAIAAKRGKGDFFSISNYGSDEGLEVGETNLTIIVRFAP